MAQMGRGDGMTIILHLDAYETERMNALVQHLSKTYKRDMTPADVLRNYIRNNMAGQPQWKHPSKS